MEKQKTLVESLKRLYAKGEVTLAKIEQLVSEGQITPDEKTYILG